MGTMTKGRFRHCPVIEDDALVGIISIGDVVKYHIAEVEMEVSAMRGYLGDRLIERAIDRGHVHAARVGPSMSQECRSCSAAARIIVNEGVVVKLLKLVRLHRDGTARSAHRARA